MTTARPAASMMMRLLAGRGFFRLSQLLSALGLQLGWGAERFAQYAAALASAGWLTAAATAGGEKTVIALLPRPAWSGVGRSIVRAALLCLAAVAGIVGLAVILEAALWMWAAAALYSAGVGVTLVCVTVLRLAGRWRVDPVAVALVGSVHLLAVPAAAAGWRPEHVLSVLGVLTAGIAVVTGVLAWHSTPAPYDGRRPAGLLSEVLLTGLSETANMVAVAFVFGLLSEGPHAEQAGDLFLVGIAGQLAIGGAAYLVRLTGADFSRAACADERAVELVVAGRFRRCAVVSMLHLVAIAAILLLAEPLGVSSRVVVITTAALAVLPTLITLRCCALAEFSGRTGRRSAAAGSVVGQLGGCLLALVLIPLAGAPGGAFTLVAGVTGQGLLAGWLLNRSSGASRSGR